MVVRGFRKYTMNPALGLVPIALFVYLNLHQLEVWKAIGISIIISLLFDLAFRYILKTAVYGLMSIATILSLILVGFFFLLSYSHNVNQHGYMIVCEINLVLLFFVMRKGKKYIGSYFQRFDMREKNLLYEVFSTITLAQHLFTLHLFAVLIYSFLKHGYGFNAEDLIVYAGIPVLIVFFLVVYESFTIRSFSVRFFKEEWYPVVNEQGKVIGKVAKSVSQRMKNRFLHPVIRIALVCGDSIYLQKRAETSTFEPEYLDNPFEQYMLFKHELNLSARNSISRQLDGESLPFSFQMKYIFENSETKRLVLFYVSKIKSADEIKNIGLLHGKFWTMKQIDHDLHSNIFCECFVREYEYLKNTILNPAIREQEVEYFHAL